MPYRDGRVGTEELEGASEAFLTSTTIELLPVTRVGDRTVGAGVPGPVWQKLHRRYREMVSEEAGVELEALPFH